MAFITAETRSDLIELSVAMLKQAPSAALLEELIALSVGGGSLADAADHIAKTDAFKAEYPSFQTAEQYAAEIFDNIATGGTVTADIRTAVIELATGMLTSGSVTKAGLALAIAEYLAAPAALLNTDFADIAQSFQNRADAAEYFVVTKELGGSTAAELAAAIASVTSDAATLTAANTAADATASAEAVVAGQTFTLTTGVDAITGSAGSDTFNGVIQAAGATGTTTSPGDVVSGGAGTDTFNLSVAGNAGAAYELQALQLSAIENVLVTNFDLNAADTTIDTSLMTGVEKVGLGASSATGDTIFTGMSAIKNASMANGSADLTLTYAGGTSGTADVQNLALSAVSAGTFTASGVETIAVTNSNTANSLTNIAGSALTKITVTGDQKFTMTGSSSVATIDASENSGNTSLIIGAGTAGTTVSLGAGDDTIDIGSTLTFADKVTGGAGTDTIKVTSGTAVFAGPSSATDYEEFYQSSGFEIIDLAATGDQTGTAGVELAYLPDVTNVVADAHVRVVDMSSATIAGSAAITFILNGTSYSTATPGAGSAAAGATEVAATINALTGYTAAVSGTTDVVITRTGSGSVINIGTFAGDASGTTTVNAYGKVSVTKMDDEVIDIYSAGTVSARLTDSSGTSDSMTINLRSNTADKSLAQVVDDLDIADGVETLNLDSSGMKTQTTTAAVGKTLTALTADTSLTTLNITGTDDLTITGITASALKTINASASTGSIQLPGAASLSQTITTGSGNDTIIMGANLKASDVIDTGANRASTAGAAGSDVVTASGDQGSAVTAAALQLSNVEALQLTNAGAVASYIDGSKLTNVGEIAMSAGSGSVSFTNMPAGTGLGAGIADDEFDGSVTWTLADATGTADALTVNYSDGLDLGSSLTLTTAGIETLNISAEKAGSNTSTMVNTNMTAATINVTGGVSTNVLALGTLNKATSAVYAGTGKGAVNFAAATGYAMDVTAVGSVVNTITLSTKADTVALTGLLGAVVQVIEGGTSASAATSDTISTTLTSTASDFTSISGFETVNLTVPAATGVGFDDATKNDGVEAASIVNILGGNANSTFTLATAGAFDTSKTAATAQTVDASTFAGKTVLVYGADDLDIFTTVKGGASALDSVTTSISDAASTTVGNNPTMTGIEYLTVASTDADVDAVINLGSVTGLARVTASFTSTGGNADQIEIDGLAAGVPVYVAGTNAADNLDVGLASATGTADALTIVSAANAAGLNLDAAGIESLSIVNSVTSSYDLAGVSPTTGSATTVTITGAGNATLTTLNTGINVINAAGLAGTLSVAASARDADVYTITGGVNNDTIAMENSADVLSGGSQAVAGADTLVVDYSAILGGVTIDMTADDQITSMDGGLNAAVQGGFENIDLRAYTGFGSVVTGTATANVITGTASNDRITAGAGNDTIQIATTGAADTDQIDGGTGTDTVSVLAGTYTPAADTSLVNVANITLGATSAVVLTTQTEGLTITTGTGANAITLGGGADTVVLGTTAATADTVTAFTTTSDIIDLSASLTAATLTIGTQVAFDVTAKATTIASITTAADTDAEVYYLKNTAGHAQVLTLAEIEGAIAAGSAATGQATVVIDNGTDTLIYADQLAQTDGSGAGLILVGTLAAITGATAIATGDLISI